MSSRPAEEMRPHEVIAAREASGCAFVPVGPMFEWHSFHLPLGTDGLVAEAVCRLAAERVGGIWFRTLSFGLDAWRTADELRAWGFREDERVYGMRFPDVPLCSEYCEAPEMTAALRNRLFAVRGCGFAHAFVVNHHGGKGQFATIEALAKELSDDAFHVHALTTYRYGDLNEESLRVGGHAGLSETTWLMAFRPELVDMTQQQDGELSVRHTGILHRTPTIEEKWNPRHASITVACALRHRVVDNVVRIVKEKAGLD